MLSPHFPYPQQEANSLTVITVFVVKLGDSNVRRKAFDGSLGKLVEFPRDRVTPSLHSTYFCLPSLYLKLNHLYMLI